MGSTFVTLDPSKSDTKKVFGSSKPQNIWLQFVPGIVTSVVNNTEDLAFGGEKQSASRRLINSILAKPHIGENLKSKAVIDEEDRYYPLFRGMVDVPMVGDQVLLCTMGGIQYYLGPVNTAGVPGYNPDHLENRDMGFFSQLDGEDDLTISKNYRERGGTYRLEKKYNIGLDDPDNDRGHFNHPVSGNEILSDTHGDLIFEGRHGNNIRIGSRDVNPYIIISNSNVTSHEVWYHGSNISLIDRGTINQYLGSEMGKQLSDAQATYNLSSDNPDINDSKRVIGGDLYNYEFGTNAPRQGVHNENQIFQTSDRITIDARNDSIFLSAMKNVVIGTGNSFILKAKNACVLDANNIYIGQEAKEPLVLGFKLTKILEDIIKAIGQLQVGATVGGISAPVQGSGSPGWIQLEQIKGDVMACLSDFHFIEDNEVDK